MGDFSNSAFNKVNKMETLPETYEKIHYRSTGNNFNNFPATKDSLDNSKTQRFDTPFYVSTRKDNP